MHNVALKFILTFAEEDFKKFIVKEVVENNRMLSRARSEFESGVYVFKSQTQLEEHDDNQDGNITPSQISRFSVIVCEQPATS